MAGRKVGGRLAAAVVTLAALLAGAAQSAADDGIDGILSAVVGVRAEVPHSARTADTLGTSRAGSGVVIDGSGLVVTVGYLILEATRAFVAPRPGEAPEVPADIVAYDHDTGLGLLRAQAALDVTPMPLGESEPLARGAPVIVASYGGRGSARPAIVVDRRPFAGYWEYLLEQAVFTSPPHPLFGGAALIDASGRLVGIGSLIVDDAAGPGESLAGNVFIPVNLLAESLGDLLAPERDRSSARPWLGIYTLEAGGQLLVQRVAQDGPAMRAGVRRGEAVTAVNGVAVDTMIAFYRALWAGTRAGDTFTITLRHGDGATRDVEVKSMDRHEWLRLR